MEVCTLMYELLYYRLTYIIINWQILPIFGDEMNQLQMGIYDIDKNNWKITPLVGFSISGGKS